ncbi:hypothetical protein [Natrinema salsiterrestre]|uniref:Uncharacterized protein n=1 Tax=Natrinema salsiterrestre TaxID=2950540 RepID=A0A9Q4Q5M3_9EURY|nr:hypothetical protein [Natrinema salsiterrestre]MDF9748308.1 hypothetical protein [Natrinema salsiterrestre]
MTFEIDWDAVKQHIWQNADDPFNARFADIENALADVASDAGGTFGHRSTVERAVMDGVLEQHGDGDDARYTFNLDRATLDADDDDEPARTEPIETGTTDLPKVLTVADDQPWPAYMTSRSEWLVALSGLKAPRAPWTHRGLKKALWNSDLDADERPERAFEVACTWADRLNTDDGLWDNLDTPDIDCDCDGDDCSACQQKVEGRKASPAYLLPAAKESIDDDDKVLLFIDWDDVRNPESDEILPEVIEWLERLNSVTEVSTSGTGLHTFVVVEDPLPMTKLDEPLNSDGIDALDDEPEVEIYQVSRFAAMTGDFIGKLPNDVARADEVVEEILDEYHEWEKTADEYAQEHARKSESSDFSGSSGKRSKYYSADCSQMIIDSHKVGTEYRGGHPEHGANSRKNNIAVTGDGQMWRCYHNGHGSGGNALHLVAVCEGYISCEDSGKESLKQLSDIEFAKLCMDARDNYDAFKSDWKPPKQALVGVAKSENLNDGDDIEKGLYDFVRAMYDDTSSSDLTHAGIM